MRMSCNSEIHDELKILKEPICPFCDQLLIEDNKEADPCCSKQNIANDNYANLCLNCGLVHGYDYVNEYIDFYENMHRIRRKSVYHRKYHIENMLNSICYENRVELTISQRTQICRIFDEIDNIIPTLNKKRKRLISTKFLIKQIFMLLGLPFEFIKVSKSKKTLQFYNRYWNEILTLKSDKIIHIIK